ncbi:hypothetical protein [Aequorivita sinensis]|uniref:hypothetical protein n=1 Tax=Aequorivita sinensis TaxID=1382458 RepID=UPI0022FFFAC8|nr:hypothetical protein [Aequorivita sinensis]
MNNFYALWRSIFIYVFLFFSLTTFAQVGIGTTNPNGDALLELDASATPGGLLLPRVNLEATNNAAPLSAHIPGMAVYNNATTSGAYGVSPGYYFNDGGRWVRIAASSDASDDWKLTGNAGTTPGTGAGQNYLGTTDGQALVLATQSNQRMRLLANGQIVVNNNVPFGGVVFNSFSGASEDAIAGGAMNGFGVYGQAEGTGVGVYGIVDNATAFGMQAINLDWNGAAILAVGAGWGGGTYIPSTGISTNGDEGIFSWGKLLSGTGVMGTGNNSTSIISSINGGGVAGSGTRNGVFGYSGNGARNNENRGNAAGIFLLDTDNNILNNGESNDNGIRATAILAGFDNTVPGDGQPAADSYFGGYFSGGTERLFSTVPSYAYVGMRYGMNANGRTGGTDYKIIGTGNVSTLINDEHDIPRIMFAPESPEIVFQDYGVGQLVNGQAHISIDPILKQSLHIDSNHPLKVFVTLEGDCNGVFVTNKSADGFTVKELQNGTSNVPFSWQIVANRADTKDRSGNVVSKHVGLRLPVGPGPINAEAKQLELKTVDKKESLKKPMESGLINEVKRELSSTGEVNNQSAESNLQSNTLEESSTSPTTESEVSKTKE